MTGYKTVKDNSILQYLLCVFTGNSKGRSITDTDDELLDMTSFTKNPEFYQDDSEDDPLLGDRSFQGRFQNLLISALNSMAHGLLKEKTARHSTLQREN